MTKQRIVVLASSQVFKTQNPAVSVEKFAEKTGLSTAYINTVLAFDQYVAPCFSCFGGSYINRYKAGEISDSEFYDGIRTRLRKTKSQLPDDTVKECWNAMCVFSKQAEQESRQLVKFLQENPKYHVVFVNETNNIQHQFNLEQLKAAVGEEALESVADRMHFINSHELGIFGKANLARQGILSLQKEGKLELNQNIEAVVSLHNAMPTASLLTEGQHASVAAERESIDIRTTGRTNIAEAVISTHTVIEQELRRWYIA